jgi:hypothetical protein
VKAALAYLAIAVVLAGVGAGFWRTGRLEQRLVGARQRLLALEYEAPRAEYDEIERTTGLLARAPWIAHEVARVRPARAVSSYWEQDYTRLVLERDAGGALVEKDPAMLRLAANAAFRSARAGGADAAAVQQLNDALALYAEALRQDPQFDLAYNFEVAARTRDAIAKPSARDRAATRPAPRLDVTMHGRQGGPPDQSSMREFKVIVPQRSDERTQQPDAGQGGKKQRKG